MIVTKSNWYARSDSDEFVSLHPDEEQQTRRLESSSVTVGPVRCLRMYLLRKIKV